MENHGANLKPPKIGPRWPLETPLMPPRYSYGVWECFPDQENFCPLFQITYVSKSFLPFRIALHVLSNLLYIVTFLYSGRKIALHRDSVPPMSRHLTHVKQFGQPRGACRPANV